MARRPARRSSAPAVCPCGGGGGYSRCCGRLHNGSAAASSPQELMRSRYTAYCTGDTAYLLRTWHPATRPPALELDPSLRWTGLELLAARGGGTFDDHGTVEFRAHYRQRGGSGTMHELSRFRVVDGAWVYVDGEVTRDG